MQFPPPEADPMNPLWEQIKQVPLDESGTIQFLVSAPMFIEEEDMTTAKKSYPIVIRNFLIGTVLGIGLNLQLKRIPNFLTWNRFLRYGVRIPTLLLPYGLFYNDTKKRVDELHFMLRKYQKRLINFQKTGNMKYLDPNNKLSKGFFGP